MPTNTKRAKVKVVRALLVVKGGKAVRDELNGLDIILVVPARTAASSVLQEDAESLVPCTITYTLPPKGRTKNAK